MVKFAPDRGINLIDTDGWDSNTPLEETLRDAYPALRWQSAMYLVARLTSFHKNQLHDTTNDFIMGGVAQSLDEESIQVIAA